MFCQSCGQQIPDEVGYCKFCGKPVSGTPEEPTQPATSGKAIASLVLGVFFLLFPAAILAVILGHLSRSDIRRSAGRLKGAGMALAGLILGYTGVALIPLLIVAAIAIPNLLRARMAANEATAVASLRVLNTAAVTHQADKGGFPSSLERLGAEGLIDGVLASGRKSGYVFTYVPGDKNGDGLLDEYTINADPIKPGNTGRRHFFTDATGIIRMETGRPANKDSPPL